MTLQEFVTKTNEPNNVYKPRPEIMCADGFSLSVQAGNHMLASIPRRFARVYDAFEIGFPSQVELKLLPYLKQNSATGGIYEYVPFDVVEEVIKLHGGISERTSKRVNEAYYAKRRNV